jgi:hypothetical protein
MEEYPGLTILNEDNMKALCDRAKEVSDEFEVNVKKLMTKEKAKFVKELRTSGYTWRAVAAECYDAWNGDWYPHSNQLMGMALCEEAMKYFENDPDFNKDDW